jgi:hypothetical protein
MEKRYFYKQAYLGNTEIFMYVDGKLTETNIINDYNLDGYTRRLRDEGYTYGYPPEEVEQLRQEYEDAKETYEEAVNNMIN